MEKESFFSSDKEYSKWYWSKFNDKCASCKNKCKQSWRVIQVICNKFYKIEGI